MSVRTRVPSRDGSRASYVLRRRALTLAGFLVAVLASLLTASATASAQDATNSLQSITPADGAVLDTSPTEIVLVFNQEIGNTEVVSLFVQCNRELQQTGLAQIDIDGLIVKFDVLAPLPKSSCFMSWLLKDGDGNTITNGTSTFRVNSDPPVASDGSGVTTSTSPFITQLAVPTQTSTVAAESRGSTDGALWFGRVLSTSAILILFGALALISVGWPEGPEYIVTVRFLRFVWLLGLAGTILFLVAYSADLSGGAFGDGLSPSAWLDLKDAGWPGRGALLRLVFVAASGWVVTRPERIIDPTTAMWAWGIPGAALLTVAMSRSDGPAPFIGFVVGIVHLLAAAVWFGGAALVARVVLRGPGDDDLVQATKAFGKVSVPAMLLTALTGVAQMVRLDGGELFTSNHGRVVLLKVVAVAAMLAVALAARQQVSLRLERASELTVGLAGRFSRAFTTEFAIGLVVLAFSGLLVSLSPARHDPLSGEAYLPAMTFTDPSSGIQARVSIAPGVVGANGIKVEIDSPAEGVNNVVVRLIPPVGAAPCDLVTGAGGCVVEQAINLNGAGTAVLLTENGVPLGVSGTWTLEFSAASGQGVIQGATNTFLVVGTDGSVSTTPTPVATTPTNVQVSLVDAPTVTAPLAGQSTTTTSGSTPGSTTGTTVP